MKAYRRIVVTLTICALFTSCAELMQGLATGLQTFGNSGYGGGMGGYGSAYRYTFPTTSVVTAPVYSSTGYSSSSNVNTNTTATSSSSGTPCRLCHGTKKCWTCYGKRTYKSSITGADLVCPNCTNGLCSHCHGTGID